jgi:twitching motility protein PilT
MLNITDRRKAKRKAAKLAIRYKIIGQADMSQSIVTTSDISSASVAFTSANSIAIGARIDAELVIPTLSRAIKFKGSIKRIEKLEEDNFLYAVVFEEMDKQDKYTLERYVQVYDLDSIMRLAYKRNASDVHFVVSQPPLFRIDGELTPLDTIALTADDIKKIILAIMTEKQKSLFEQNLELDFSSITSDGIRFRVNVHLEKGNLEAALRLILEEIRGILELGLPVVVEELSRRKRGLVVVSGPAGSGKSTTLATMIDVINREKRCMVISIEDPIEFIHESKKSIIKQREIGSDTLSFTSALKHTLRQDPNVIFVGEMRDLESISMSITAAETGHLVLTTLHTPDTVECVNRITDVYPGEQQNQVRSQLAACLEGVITQLLLPRKDGKGRVVATEVLVATPAIRNLIRNKKLEQIYSYIQAGEQYGMHTMDDSIFKLVEDGIVDVEVAKEYVKNPARFR